MPLAINLAGDRVARWILVHVVKAVSDEVTEVYNENCSLLVGPARIVFNLDFVAGGASMGAR
jgi:hypothetical protein